MTEEGEWVWGTVRWSNQKCTRVLSESYIRKPKRTRVLSESYIRKPKRTRVLSESYIRKPKRTRVLSESYIRKPKRTRVLSESYIRKPKRTRVLSERYIRKPKRTRVLSESYIRKPKRTRVLSESYIRKPKCTKVLSESYIRQSNAQMCCQKATSDNQTHKGIVRKLHQTIKRTGSNQNAKSTKTRKVRTGRRQKCLILSGKYRNRSCCPAECLTAWTVDKRNSPRVFGVKNSTI